MDTNSNRKLQSDWYSPTRLHNSPVEYDFPVCNTEIFLDFLKGFFCISLDCWIFILFYFFKFLVIFLKGDRFIPNRSLMDLDQAHTLLTTPNQKSSKPKFKVSRLFSILISWVFYLELFYFFLNYFFWVFLCSWRFDCRSIKFVYTMCNKI